MKDPVTKHHELATTGHAEGFAKGGSVKHSHHPHHGNAHHHVSEKGEHKGFGSHGHQYGHEHFEHPRSGHTGHDGKGIRSLVHEGHEPSMHESETYHEEIDTDSGGGEHHNHGVSSHSTGGTRNRL